MKQYKASLDNLAKVLTGVVLVILLVISAEFAGELGRLSFRTSADIFSLFGMIIITGVTLLAFLYAPKGYALTDDSLQIQRRINTINIPFNEIREVRPLTPGEAHLMLRTWGVGGFFGYFGKYWSKNLGHFSMYCTQYKNRLLITKANDKKLVISPDDVSLLYELQGRI